MPSPYHPNLVQHVWDNGSWDNVTTCFDAATKKKLRALNLNFTIATWRS